jgi:putative endonuclease
MKKINNEKQILGRLGENIAREYILNIGYKILLANYRTKVGEIDIIAEHENFLVFIEVKTRNNKNFKAIDSITRKKQLTMARVAEIFISQNDRKFDNKEVRFDLVLIDEGKIRLIQNAFFI